MTAEEKDALSHRGRALRELPALLARIVGLPPA
jgi:inosine/xanthosine triphosphate pyrophosphatase family protein